MEGAVWLNHCFSPDMLGLILSSHSWLTWSVGSGTAVRLEWWHLDSGALIMPVWHHWAEMCSWTDLCCCSHQGWRTAPTHGLESPNWGGENFSSQLCPSVESNKTWLSCWWGRQEMDLPCTVLFLLPVAREEPAWHHCEVLQLKAPLPSNFMAPSSAPWHFGVCPHLESTPGKSLSSFGAGQDQAIGAEQAPPACVSLSWFDF